MIDITCGHCGNKIELDVKMATKNTNSDIIVMHILTVLRCKKCGNFISNSTFPAGKMILEVKKE